MWRETMGRWLALVTLAAGGAAWLSLAAGWWWVLDLASPFQVQYAVVLVLGAVGLLVCGKWRWALVACVLALLPAARVAPYFFPVGHGHATAGETRLRVVAFNLWSANQRHDEVLRWVRQTAPDVVVLPEVTLAWARQLDKLADILPYSVERTHEGNFGMAVLSRHPLRAERVDTTGEFDGVFAIRVEVAVTGRVLVVHGVHPPPPLGRQMAVARDRFLRDLAVEAASAPRPVVIAGDCNATPWCHAMRPLRAGGMRDARLGRGPVATWRRATPWVAIPIDHVLVSDQVRVDHFETGPELGSDHRPVVADVVW
jgi:endonuclease/exonuclease/phosphatase (EEP) superfamily protein YafD